MALALYISTQCKQIWLYHNVVHVVMNGVVAEGIGNNVMLAGQP